MKHIPSLDTSCEHAPRTIRIHTQAQDRYYYYRLIDENAPDEFTPRQNAIWYGFIFVVAAAVFMLGWFVRSWI